MRLIKGWLILFGALAAGVSLAADKTIVNESLLCQIAFPESWEANEVDGFFDIVVSAASPQVKKLTAYVLVEVSTLREGSNLKNAVDARVDEMKGWGHTITSKTDITLSGLPAFKIESLDNPKQIALQNRRTEYIVAAHGRTYTIRAMAYKSAYDDFLKDIDGIVNSFKLIDKDRRDDAKEMPARVHVFEDYETDIEKRWWLAGKLVTDGGSRCCQATETKNFDRDKEDQSKVWKAVIFNPVPGPPMGPRTRLSFRYFLKGTNSLRVQIYSLTNNYHRFLMLNDLPQEKWQHKVVDMTAARRPDGSGGPLAQDERIDDIQFYIPQNAELLIDDIVLYEDSAAGEKRPLPRRIIFTGWFDTGKQGAEWPGTFEIVSHEKPLTWKAARSVARAGKQESWIRVQLRGERRLGKSFAVRFRYKLTGNANVEVAVFNSKAGAPLSAKLSDLKQNEWAETTASFEIPYDNAFADELHFVIPLDAALQVDDVLLFEP